MAEAISGGTVVSSRRARRYEEMFRRLGTRGEGAFVPFVVLGDPDPVSSLEIIRTLIGAGADALELGLPFSDPVADGSIVQAAAGRALASGVTLADCRKILRSVREEHLETPLGLLAYANLVLSRRPGRFYVEIAGVGVDSVLVPDLPVAESGPAAGAARQAGVAPVFIAPPNADPERLGRIARESEGYVYVTARPGVTGDRTEVGSGSASIFSFLAAAGAPPALLGFGISSPEQVRAARQAGAAGAVAGSAVIRILEEHAGDPGSRDAALDAFVRKMKAATLPAGPGAAA